MSYLLLLLEVLFYGLGMAMKWGSAERCYSLGYLISTVWLNCLSLLGVDTICMLSKLNYLFLNFVGLQLIYFTEIVSLESYSISSAILLSNYWTSIAYFSLLLLNCTSSTLISTYNFRSVFNSDSMYVVFTSVFLLFLLGLRVINGDYALKILALLLF